MKKIFLLLTVTVLSLSITSCSDDDSAPTNNGGNNEETVSFKINGIQKTFEHIVVNTENIDSEVLLTIIASENNEANEFITFQLYQDETGGAEVDTEWRYYDANKVYEEGGFNNEEAIQIDQTITENNSEKLSGTFSGTLSRYEQEAGLILLEITEGTFNINR
ncbi:hypothetical protein GCM10007424_19860 [Flavobacterium suaedae]|uniref:DUF4352 domain-containing protein n=1 Tax=Flavobacterium suaedae TaxID=1767027 RepID=A0ABQ1JVT1_9FLAO|nr:hypothetical protein [Flavobacterium suaedae]GGB79714.1 hypothetical protein GCM10007424_19860 [Flavobacterium suaedae]